MDRKKGLSIIVFLVLLLGVVDAAWVLYYKGTITTNVIGEQSAYSISWEFNDTLSLDTTNGPDSTSTLMKIDSLDKDLDMGFEIETRRTNLDSNCPNYEDDCTVTLAHIYNNGTEIKTILSNKQTITNDGNFTLFKDVDNYVEYKVECVENSCSQRISSNVTLEQIQNI